MESGGDFVIALDTAVTPELLLEGQARDLVREIQDMRKEADLHIADRIRLSVQGADALLAAHAGYIQSETLCVGISSELSNPLVERSCDIEGSTLQIALVREV